MLSNGTKHPKWTDPELEQQLCQILKESKDACVTTVETIEEHLRDVESESRHLESAIEQDAQTSSDAIGSRSWRQRIAKKLRFSFSKSRLEDNLSALRSLNDDFRTLSSQILTPETPQRYEHSDARRGQSCQEMEKYQVIRQAAQHVYEALGKACTKHTEHQAQFCVEVEQPIIYDDRGAQVKFKMAYTNTRLTDNAAQSDFIWFIVDSTSGDLSQYGLPLGENRSQNGLTSSLKRQIAADAKCTPKKAKKSVRFESSPPRPKCAPSWPDATIANAILSDDNMRTDLCDFLRRRLRDQPMASECVCVLENSARCRNVVYPSSAERLYSPREGITLGELISRRTEEKPIGAITLYDRLRLARILAVAVLQYHSTLWLENSWRSEDLYFFGDGSPSAEETLSLTLPHLNVRVKEPCGQPGRASTFPSHSLARNPLLFSLGVVLLEIAYTSTIRKLQSPLDLEDGQVGQYTEFLAARRLAKSAKSDMGGRYHKIVEKLVECDLGCGTDLDDPQFQAAFHSDVICPLQRLEEKLHKFHLD